MKKIFNIFIITFMLSIILPLNISAANISTLNVKNTNGKLTVSGTTESGVYAIAVLVYSEDNLVHMETCSNDNNYSCELNKTFEEGKYTVKVADYNGGDYITKEVTVSNSTDEVNNPKTGDNILNYIIIGAISLFSIISCIIFIRKRKNK